MSDIGKSLVTELDVIKNRKANPQEGSYTSYLFSKGVDKILKKVGEEATEVIIAARIITILKQLQKFAICFSTLKFL